MSKIQGTLQSIKNIYTTFSLKDVTRHKKKSKSLIEILSIYPNKGFNFKVWQKGWPVGKYYIISHLDLKTNRNGEAWGMYFKNGKKFNKTPVIVKNSEKRHLWNHEIQENDITLDNGMVFNEKDFERFRKINFPKLKSD